MKVIISNQMHCRCNKAALSQNHTVKQENVASGPIIDRAISIVKMPSWEGVGKYLWK